MNRFVRNNLLLITVIGGSCVVALGLLIFSVIRYVEMTDCMDQIKNIQQEVKKLASKNPSPHVSNKEPILANTRIFEKATADLEANFRPAMLAVAEKFVKSLQESKPQKDEDGKIIPLTIESFRNAYDEMWRNGKGYVDKMYRYKVFCEDRFKNWNSVVSALLPEAQKFTTEPLTAETLPEVLMSYIGIPRVMGEQPDNMVKYMKNYQSALVKKLTSTKFNTEGVRIDWFGFDPDPTSGQIAVRFNNPAEQYPQIARVWDIYGDVIDRMVKCSRKIAYTSKEGKKMIILHTPDEAAKLKDHHVKFTEYDDRIETFYGIGLRAALAPLAANNSGEGDNGGLRNAIAGNDEGPFKVYRMRITVGGTMEGIRTFIRAFDEAYKNKRVYVVKSVALYAERDGAQEIFRSRNEQAGITTGKEVKKSEVPARRGRGGRGRGRAVMEEQHEETQVQSKVDPAVIAEMRRQQEEANKKLNFYERIGYGDVLIGDDKTCKAVIDFDYYELKYEAK